MGQQGIVPSNYVEMMAAGPPIPALPQAPPGYAPQADAKSAYPPQQMGMPQQQMGMVPQQQMGMMPQQQMAQQTTVVQVGAASPAVFVNPGGATCHTVRAHPSTLPFPFLLVSIFCFESMPIVIHLRCIVLHLRWQRTQVRAIPDVQVLMKVLIQFPFHFIPL